VGWRGAPRARHAHGQAISALAPVVVVLSFGAAATLGAAQVHAGLGGGPWAWLGDAAVALDVCAALALCGVPAALRRQRLVRSGIAQVDVMAGDEFEVRLVALFASLGYDVTRTGARGDFGADLVLDDGDERLVVQAKRYDGTVGIEAVQQAIGATRYYDAQRALVVTNSTCTPAARELAAANGVDLVERHALVGLLAAHPLARCRPASWSLLAHEVAGGFALAAFAAGCVLKLAWWVLRAGLRAPFVGLRARR
jgi:restriction system protein